MQNSKIFDDRRQGGLNLLGGQVVFPARQNVRFNRLACSLAHGHDARDTVLQVVEFFARRLQRFLSREAWGRGLEDRITSMQGCDLARIEFGLKELERLQLGTLESLITTDCTDQDVFAIWGDLIGEGIVFHLAG